MKYEEDLFLTLFFINTLTKFKKIVMDIIKFDIVNSKNND